MPEALRRESGTPSLITTGQCNVASSGRVDFDSSTVFLACSHHGTHVIIRYGNE